MLKEKNMRLRSPLPAASTEDAGGCYVVKSPKPKSPSAVAHSLGKERHSPSVQLARADDHLGKVPPGLPHHNGVHQSSR